MDVVRDTSQLAVSLSGHAFVIWTGVDPNAMGARERLYAVVYDPRAQRWSSAMPLQRNAQPVLSAAVASDGQGGAVVVWAEHSQTVPIDTGGTGTRFSNETAIYANRYDAGQQQWQAAQLVRDLLESAGSVHVAMTAGGDAVAVWNEQCRSAACIQGSAFIGSSLYSGRQQSWTTAVHLNQSVIQRYAAAPHSAIDANGNAVVVWEEFNSRGFRVIYAACYDATAGRWGTPEVINQTNYGAGTAPSVIMDLNGNAMAAWAQGFAFTIGVGGARLDRAHNEWSPPERIDDFVGETHAAAAPKLAVAGNGDAILGAYTYGAIPTLGIEMSRLYAAASNRWYLVTRLDETTYPDPEVNPPQGLAQFGLDVAMDPFGNALAIWAQQTDARQVPGGIYARRFLRNVGWDEPQKVDAVIYGAGSSPLGMPHIGFDGQGNAYGTWMERGEDGSTLDLMVAEYR
jgi:uncharacterized protein YheU (UPF0270 family)